MRRMRRTASRTPERLLLLQPRVEGGAVGAGEGEDAYDSSLIGTDLPGDTEGRVNA